MRVRGRYCFLFRRVRAIVYSASVLTMTTQYQHQDGSMLHTKHFQIHTLTLHGADTCACEHVCVVCACG